MSRFTIHGEESQAIGYTDDPVIIDAKQEYSQLGTLTTTTFIELTALGIDAQEFINNLENTYHG